MPANARSLRPVLLAIALFGCGWGSVAHGQADAAATYGPGGVYARIPAVDEYGRDQLAMFRAWNPDPVGHHEANLRAIQPALASVVRRAQADNPDLRFVIGSGRRDRRLQRQAVAWGWSRVHASSHRSGNAVDLWPLDAEGRVTFDPGAQNRIAAAMKQAATALGVSLRWGGRFRGYKHMDRSHFELSLRASKGQDYGQSHITAGGSKLPP